MSAYNNPNDPNRDRVTETSGTHMRTGDVHRNDLDDRGGSFWPWVIGLLVLLAVGWIVIEAFDRDDSTGVDDAVPAAGELRDEGTQMRDEVLPDDPNRLPRDDTGRGLDTGVTPNNDMAPSGANGNTGADTGAGAGQ